MLDPAAIREQVAALKEEMIGIRRHLHENPEPSGFEFNTASAIVDHMKALGLEPVWVKEKVAPAFILDTGRPGKTLALRADIDALPMPEDPENLKGPKAVVSKVPDVCHACGHDGHIAMLLTAAKVLVQNKDRLSGRILFLFESSEENGVYGTQYLYADFIKQQKADAIWGIHLYAAMKAGGISVQAGPRMSGSGSFHIRIVGRGGHGSRPDQSINPVVTAAEITSKLQTIVPLQIAPDEAAVVTVSCLQGGAEWNIIPDTCDIRGGIRYFSVENYHRIINRMRTIVDAICAANDCSAEYQRMPKPAFPIINHAELSKISEAAVDRVLPGARMEVPAWMASESYGVYQNVVPGVFAFVGIANEELGSGAAHHNARFDLDEEALEVGACATLQFVSDFLG